MIATLAYIKAAYTILVLAADAGLGELDSIDRGKIMDAQYALEDVLEDAGMVEAKRD